jgi:hypothetical protein
MLTVAKQPSLQNDSYFPQKNYGVCACMFHGIELKPIFEK